jgi:hypothetical protein
MRLRVALQKLRAEPVGVNESENVELAKSPGKYLKSLLENTSADRREHQLGAQGGDWISPADQ